MIDEKNVFYKNGDFTLIKGDSFKIIETFDEKIFDMIFADPPYFLSSGGISCHSGKQVSVDKGDWDKTLSIEQKLDFHRKWIALCRRVLKDDGTIMISATLHSVYAIGVALEMEGFSIINNIIWQKTNPAPNLACRCFTHSTETILWARKQLTIKRKGKHYFNYEKMKELNGGKQMKDFWEFEVEENPIIIKTSTAGKSQKKYGRHPTQKPTQLLERLIEAASKENDLILDPFCGSCTTGIVANQMHRKFIGIDIDNDYLELSKRRYLGGKEK